MSNAPRNSYATRAEFLQWITPQDTSASTVDDTVIDGILESVSRFIDGQTRRTFYPRVETRYYDAKLEREILLDDDLLEIITLTNGDDASVPSTEYHLIEKNLYPKHAIRLKKGSAYFWDTDITNVDEYVIDLLAFWGYRERYSVEAWKLGGTLGAAISDTTTKAFTASAGHSLLAGQIIKINNEVQVVETVSTNTITPFNRGDNGSTAATHDNGTSVYIWQVEQDVHLACKMIAQNVYRRFGVQSGQDENIVTASGVVITPRDIPATAAMTMNRLQNRL